MEALKNKWFLLMANAAIAIIAGVVFLFVPEQTLKTIGFAAGIVILLSGLFLVFGAFSYAKKGQNMFFWLVEGIINLSLGIILIVNPAWLVEFLLILIGLWALILGVYQLYTGFVSSKQIKNNSLLKINGLASAVIGLVLLFKPDMVASFVVQLLGIISILIGGIMMYFAFLIKKAGKVQEAIVVEDIEEPISEEEKPEK
jgi:uncharacterized membrane protein HdeD (DUF308 family)